MKGEGVVTGEGASSQSLALPERETIGRFRFRGKEIPFSSGDTIASALFASGMRLISRSFKYHRPRGFYDLHGFGADTLVSVDGEPNVPADRRLAVNGMDVRTQNAWPSIEFDVMAGAGTFVPMLPNGFYYKMFHKPRWAWPFFEKLLRRVAGLGKIDTSGRAKETHYEKRYLFPDVCVVGAGPAGLSAALAAANDGRRVVLIERMASIGGHAVTDIEEVQSCEDESLNGVRACDAVADLARDVVAHDGIELITGASVFGVYEDNYVAAENGRELFKVRSGAVVVAGGASDRHLVFEQNDLPGVMTARAVERLVGVHGVAPGRRAILVTCHDGGYRTAQSLRQAGVEIVAVVDARDENPSSSSTGSLRESFSNVIFGKTIHQALGRRSVSGAIIGAVGGGSTETLDCDLIVIAVGFSPQLGLLSMGRGRPTWDSERGVFGIQDLPAGLYAAGDINGPAGFARLYNEGRSIGKAAARGLDGPPSERGVEERIKSLPADIAQGGSRHFICRCMDVTRKEMQASIAEGFDQTETLKRFTSTGMGRCQGKTCHEAAARLLGFDTDRSTPEGPGSVPTTFRPPFAPVSFGVLAGRAPHLAPIRRTSMHALHEEAGASFMPVGQWLRPETYTDTQEEVLAVRKSLGMTDVSTLGKLQISGPDARKFLNFMLPGKFSKLGLGRVRYHTMISEDGIVYEDGTTARLGDDRYLISTTTGNADSIFSRFRWWVTTEGFDVDVCNLSPVLAAVNVAGPNARTYLEGIVDIDLSNDVFPYMSVREARIDGVSVFLFRIGFTGELSYEVHFPAEYGEDMWNYLMKHGESFDIKPFGVESQRVLRLEKGHILPGTDTDALSNPYEAGVGFTVKDDKPDFIGKAFVANFKERGIKQKLISYKLEPGAAIPEDGVVIVDAEKLIGRVTSSRLSPSLGHGIGLGWVMASYSDPGTKVEIRLSNGRSVWGEVIEGHAAYDPDGQKLRS